MGMGDTLQLNKILICSYIADYSQFFLLISSGLWLGESRVND